MNLPWSKIFHTTFFIAPNDYVVSLKRFSTESAELRYLASRFGFYRAGLFFYSIHKYVYLE